MTMKERRKNPDRRQSDAEPGRSGKSNRRISPDRRLNSISATWIPINHVYIHPLTRDVFGKH
jgi:hypothetical protein